MSIHDRKIYGYAFWDIVLTVGFVGGITYYSNGGLGVFLLFFILIMILGLCLHKIFGVDTKLTKQFDELGQKKEVNLQ